MSMTNEGFKWISSAVAKLLVHKIAEIQKLEMEFPVSCMWW